MQKCAFDFLSKPLKTDELEKILLKFRVKHSPESKSDAAHPGELHPAPPKKVRVLTPTGHLFVYPKDIAFIKSAGKHSFMTNSENKEQKTCIGMKKLVSTFHDSDFELVHKSYAINRRYLHDVPFKYLYCTLEIGDELVTIPLSWEGKKRLK